MTKKPSALGSADLSSDGPSVRADESPSLGRGPGKWRKMNPDRVDRPSRRDLVTAAAAASVLAQARATGAKGASMNHVVLLGDSAFDNAAYVSGGPDVVGHLRQRLPSNWRASLLAVDGTLIASISQQLARVPSDASHLVISIGGNDALRRSSVLDAPARSVAESLSKLADIREQFQAEYGAMVDAVLRRGLPTALCTIYDPRYPNPLQRRISIAALAVINDGIIRASVGRGLPMLDLRVVCDDEADFANPIEPSVQGGWKIAGAITSLLLHHEFGRARSEVFTR